MITTTSADGTNVRAIDEGQGRVILVLHPGLDDGKSWSKVAARLAKGYRVVRLHRRRYRLDITSPCSIADEVDDVLAVAKLIGEPMLVVGHSSGGVVALEALAASRSTFAGAVVYEPPILIGAPEWREPVEQAKVRLDAYARIEVPTVLLGGERSPAHLSERIEALARALPRADKVVLPGQGHDAHVKAPDAVARVIEAVAGRVLR